MLNCQIFKTEMPSYSSEELKTLVNKFNLQLENEGIKINEAYKAIDTEIKNPSNKSMESIRNSNDSITAGYVAILRLLENKRDIIIPVLKKEMECERAKLESRYEAIKKKIRDGYRALYNDRLNTPDETPGLMRDVWFEEYNKSKEYNEIKWQNKNFGSPVYVYENPVKAQIEKLSEVIKGNLLNAMKGQTKSIDLNLDYSGKLEKNSKIETY